MAFHATPFSGGSVFIVKQPIIYNKGEIND